MQYDLFPDNNWELPENINILGIRAYEKIKDTGSDIFPEKHNIFRFLNTDFENIKYVIVGMDPYASVWKSFDHVQHPIATGRSFEVSNMTSWTQKVPQASIRNILCALYYAKKGYAAPISVIREEIEDGAFKILPPKEWFIHMEKQGVVFLNASLTVLYKNPGSHKKYWDDYMTALSSYIVKRKNPVWLLWGNDALKRFEGIVPDNRIRRSCHPRLQGFIKENPFAGLDINLTGF